MYYICLLFLLSLWVKLLFKTDLIVMMLFEKLCHELVFPTLNSVFTYTKSTYLYEQKILLKTDSMLFFDHL